MNGYNFTERVRATLAFAREEAVARAHNYVGTEHLLLGIIREGEGVASAVLQLLGIDAAAVVRRIDETAPPGKPGQPTGPDLPYTSRAKKTIELAMAEARALDHVYVGTEHLLLGLIREEKGIAAQVLSEAGGSLDAARAETLRLLGATEPPMREAAPAGRVARLQLRVEFEDGSVAQQDFESVPAALAYLSRHA